MWVTEKFRVRLDAIQEALCAVCKDGVFDDQAQFVRCGLAEDQTCTAREYLPELMELVPLVGSPRLQDHVRAVRQRICPHCEHRASNGRCRWREQQQCALDSHLDLLVNEIQSMPM